MTKPKVEECAEILNRYLEQKDVEWESFPLEKGQGKSTLSFTNDMKINVLSMVREMGIGNSGCRFAIINDERLGEERITTDA